MAFKTSVLENTLDEIRAVGDVDCFGWYNCATMLVVCAVHGV
jgi:hypothetical protein